MDARKGIKRLSILVAGLYFGFWAVAAFVANRNIAFASSQLDKHPYGDPQNAYFFEYMNEQGWWLEKATIWGAFPAIALLILSPIIFWVYRGFFPKGAK